uniref:Ribosomal protein L14 n=1 Tax=Chroomonas placoidea TaxID=173977 RepID=A0A2P1G837_9CRYP|nr:ribosomal protein L14 [Chroomonas placoidea]AVM81127.1 ribosomal protein L14 [Chroomonas placoidea]
MIQTQTIFKSGDNSGIRFVKCIQVYSGQLGSINSLILVAIKSVKSCDKIKKGDLFKSIIVRLRCKKHRKTGHSILFNENTVVLLNKKNELYGTRVFGPICNELRKKNFLKLLSLGSIII